MKMNKKNELMESSCEKCGLVFKHYPLFYAKICNNCGHEISQVAESPLVKRNRENREKMIPQVIRSILEKRNVK